MLNLLSKLLYLVYLQRYHVLSLKAQSATMLNLMSKLLYLVYLQRYHVFKTLSAKIGSLPAINLLSSMCVQKPLTTSGGRRAVMKQIKKGALKTLFVS